MGVGHQESMGKMAKLGGWEIVGGRGETLFPLSSSLMVGSWCADVGGASVCTDVDAESLSTDVGSKASSSVSVLFVADTLPGFLDLFHPLAGNMFI